MSNAAKMVEQHKKRKEELMKKEEQLNFSYGLEASLTKEEREADVKL